MITVSIKDSDGIELGRIRIIQRYGFIAETYTAEIVVERQGAVGLIRKNFEYESTGKNVLPLLKAALEVLEPHQQELENVTSTPDMAGRFNRTLKALQARARELRYL